MLTIEIPGRDPLHLHHLILDYNGTIALDGTVIPAIRSRLDQLAQLLTIHVITADTHGTASRQCQELPVQIGTYPTESVGFIKAEYARKLDGGCVCIGNGYNDIQMSDVCDLSICVIGPEGCCAALINHCDIAVTSIADALDLLCQPDRLRATLRT